MKKLRFKKPNLSRRAMLVGAGIAVVSVAGVSALTVNSSDSGADEKPPIVIEVERQAGVLDNHEDRITNAESDINSLQEQTGSTPSTERVVVREATPKPIPVVEEPEPIVVVSYKQIPLDGGNVDCEYTYSDGTTYKWHWKKVNPQGSWQTDGNGNNGHWATTTNTIGSCDSSSIGKEKI